MSRRWPRARRGLALALLAACGAAGAHDTWLRVEPSAPSQLVLALGTGEHYPTMQTPIQRDELARQGCRNADGVRPLRPGRSTGSALLLAVPRSAGPMSCWVQTEPLDIELQPAFVERYLDEIAAAEPLRQAWARQQAAGKPWRERYAKHARIVLDGAAGAPQPSSAAPDMALDLRIETPPPWRAGDTVKVRVLRDGRALAELPLQWLNATLPRGLWTRTDAEGRAELKLPAAGEWLLRGTDLRQTDAAAGTWDSRFLTLVFDAGR